MNEHDRKLSEKICTWYECKKPGIYYHTDVDEPHGSQLLLCGEHNKKYLQQLEDEFPEE